MSTPKRVAYFFDEEIGSFTYGPTNHPMKPFRLELTNELVASYNLLEHPQISVFRPQPASTQQLTMFHGDDYIDFLERVTGQNVYGYNAQTKKFNLDHTDNPVFADMAHYCKLYTGASLGCAYRINQGLCDVAINWSGGATHAKKHHASGFNYVNDVALTIIELLKYHKRVMYIDLGNTHGDGVEEAFYHTNRVLSINFHKYGEFYPNTGHIADTGVERGSNFTINCPFKAGLSSDQFIQVFDHIVGPAVSKYQPNAIVVSCGTDGIIGDAMGVMNLTSKAYLHAVGRLLELNIPMVLLGGNGTNIANAARIWTQLTALCLGGHLLSDEIPYHEYLEHYGPDFKLGIGEKGVEDCMLNLNTQDDLTRMVNTIHANINNMKDIPTITYTTSLDSAVKDGFDIGLEVGQ